MARHKCKKGFKQGLSGEVVGEGIQQQQLQHQHKMSSAWSWDDTGPWVLALCAFFGVMEVQVILKCVL